ncbi:MAG: hypothetical protein OdinLCB4_007110 [Candidatus Odinarchaeum yellowstonii]|uniref:Uncharacterized protein n=1 Tax=Odinarchaeota yellowstonii (strain LCB_4) TaxID=1841599 RepID=A0AAF0D226_ODILC|nr:MAG: hypothetical protein OdinLCB4_007110 [Candidatus Odinarchaeum yellowstonii]
MQENPAIILTAIAASAAIWAASTIFIYIQNHRKLNPLSKTFITLSLTIAVSLPLLSLELFYPKGPVFATANLIYNILIAAGFLTLIYGLTKIYFNQFKTTLIVASALILITALKIYDYIDWVILKLPEAKIISAVGSLIITAAALSLIPVIILAHRKTNMKLLKNKLELLLASIILILTLILIVIMPGNPLYQYRFIIGTALLVPFTLLGAISVTYRYKETLTLISLETGRIQASNQKDERITALLLKHTSKENMCEYYDQSLKSKCKLDPSSYKLEDCKGVKYRNGLICPKIVEYEKETKNL